jgi:hypothetical protein
MKHLHRFFLLAFALTLCLAPVATALAADQPALPDYSKAPYEWRTGFDGVPPFHPDWEGTTCQLFTDNERAVPGANGVYVYKDKDGKLKYAVWLAVQEDRCPIYRGYNRTGDAWVFEQENRPCDEQKSP